MNLDPNPRLLQTIPDSNKLSPNKALWMCFEIPAVPGSTTVGGRSAGTRRATLVTHTHRHDNASANSDAQTTETSSPSRWITGTSPVRVNVRATSGNLDSACVSVRFRYIYIYIYTGWFIGTVHIYIQGVWLITRCSDLWNISCACQLESYKLQVRLKFLTPVLPVTSTNIQDVSLITQPCEYFTQKRT
jgi:hypothetical protein